MNSAENLTRPDGPWNWIERRRCPSRRLGARLADLALGCLLAALLGTEFGCSRSPDGQAVAPKPPEVTVGQVVERAVTDYEEFTGRMEAVESVEIRARVRGYLNAVHFTEGQEVTAGTLLFEIDPRTFEAELKNAEGQKAQWMAKRDKAQADVTRYEGLVPTGAASAQDLDKARAELGEAIAAIQSAEAAIDRAKLELEFARITAPVDGQVGQALITKGNLVQSGSGADSLLTTLVSVNPMYVYFGVNERSLLEFRRRGRAALPEAAVQPTIAELKIPVYLGLSDEDGFPHEGMMDFADNRVDPSTGTIRVRANFDNSTRVFKPGLFARVRVPVGNSYQALLVSQMAFGTEQGQKYLLVVNEQNVVEKRFVKPGPPQDDGLQVVTEGLKPGDWIVVNGLQRARPGKPVTPQRGEMPVLRPSALQTAAVPTTQATAE
jgi:multidrug efflux system membrane fusion protein